MNAIILETENSTAGFFGGYKWVLKTATSGAFQQITRDSCSFSSVMRSIIIRPIAASHRPTGAQKVLRLVCTCHCSANEKCFLVYSHDAICLEFQILLKST